MNHFNRLRQEGNNYYFTSTRDFISMVSLDDYIERVFEFAWNMTFGNVGAHRNHRTGGQVNRRNGELFANTFQGKLAEFGIFNLLSEHNITSDEPTLDEWELGRWDETDLIVGDSTINIKSAANFSHLLLLETGDWNNTGQYIPNIGSGHDSYDFHILTRIRPDIKGIFRRERLFYSDSTNRNSLWDIINNNSWEFNSPGYITVEDLRYLINNNFILPQNSLLSGRTSMDAENYYCQSGDMHHLTQLFELLG